MPKDPQPGQKLTPKATFRSSLRGIIWIGLIRFDEINCFSSIQVGDLHRKNHSMKANIRFENPKKLKLDKQII
ncbi:MAG: hypothetical protein K9H16_11455 [Bacteroidales bacterium]|nr:hypothetical protein [Bacteroidales bacterium]